jgi:flagella basal body P-ring formation protein FlgA
MKWLWFLAALRLGAQCQPLEGEFIVARQLAAANPAFAALAPETPLGRAPMAGLRRIFLPGELRRLAVAHGIPSDGYEEICFQWSLAPVDRVRVLETMRKSLSREGAHLELLDTPRIPAPPGELVFPMAALKPAGNGIHSWVGFVRYGQDRHFPIRTMVRVSIPGVRLVARGELHPGQMVTSQQVAVEAGEFGLAESDLLTDAADVVGKATRRTIAAGAVLRRGDFVELPLVTSGQIVEVEVRNGATRLLASGQAEQSGRRGEMIAVRNPSSGVRYRARVERPGSVALVIGPATHERNIQRNP